jgi:hypothetical protein
MELEASLRQGHQQVAQQQQHQHQHQHHHHHQQQQDSSVTAESHTAQANVARCAMAIAHLKRCLCTHFGVASVRQLGHGGLRRLLRLLASSSSESSGSGQVQLSSSAAISATALSLALLCDGQLFHFLFYIAYIFAAFSECLQPSLLTPLPTRRTHPSATHCASMPFVLTYKGRFLLVLLRPDVPLRLRI